MKTLSSFFHECEEKSSHLFKEFIWILNEKFGLDKANLLSGETKLLNEHIESLESWIDLRKQDYPIQYFIGATHFCGYDFYVDEGALIPRNETEEIAYWVIENQKNKNPKSILDIGSGTGCLGLGVALNLKSINLAVLIEPYERALKSLRKNVSALSRDGLEVEVCSVEFESYAVAQKFDVIVSNPPYIYNGDPDVAKGVYDFEPKEALFGGPLGWEKEVAWALKAYDMLNIGGLMVFEFSHDQREILMEKLADFKPSFYKDSFGRDRFMAIEKR